MHRPHPLPAPRRAMATAGAALLLATATGPAPAADQPDITADLGPEAALFTDIPSVYGASRYDQKVTDAPASVSIVTAEDISRFGYRTLGAALESLRGFYVSYDRNYAYVGVRGFGRPGDYNSRILVLLDGQRINEGIYGMMLVETAFPVDVGLIDRIEVIRGPGSSLYGSGALFAVVNVITRRGRDIGGLEMDAGAGSLGTLDGRLTAGDRLTGGTEFLLSASAYASDGDDALGYPEFAVDGSDGVARNADDDAATRVLGRVARGDLSLAIGYSQRDKTVPTAPYETVFDTDRTRTEDGFAFAHLEYRHLAGNGFETTGRLAWQRYDYRGDYLYDYAEPGDPAPVPVVARDEADDRWLGVELAVNGPIGHIHRLSAGTEVRHYYIQQQLSYDVDPYTSYLDDERDSTQWALYLQDELALRDDLIVNAGLRFDHYEQQGGATNPRLAVIWSPAGATSVKLMYGRAFRAPYAYELYYQSPPDTRANPNLASEEMTATELAVEQGLSANVRGIATVYHYEIDDLVDQIVEGDGSTIFRNVARVHATGAELELEGRWAEGWSGRLSYAWQRAEDADSGAALTNSPMHIGRLNMLAPLGSERLGAGLELQYTAGRRRPAGGSSDEALVVNLTLLASDVLPGLRLSGTLENALDEDYADPVSLDHRQAEIAQDGRTAWLRLRYALAFPH